MPDGLLLHRLNAALRDSEAVADGELLRRYAEGRDPAAFELLVRRHAELVWSVCRSTHADDFHAAEDAFQAAFVALAKRAGRIRQPSAAGWLFRVARHAALRVKRRAKTETLFDDLTGHPQGSLESTELQALVHGEVHSLSEAFREPVLLCFYEGYTHEQAAKLLGVPIGTLASRLARAKERLRSRLALRGVGLPVAVLGVSGLSAELVNAAVRGMVSDAVRILSSEVLSTMATWKTKLAVAAMGLLAMTLVGVGVATAYQPTAPRDEPKPTAKAPEGGAKPQAKELDEELKKLQGEWEVNFLGDGLRERLSVTKRGMIWTIKGRTIRIKVNGERIENLDVTLGATDTTKWIDLTPNTGPKGVVGIPILGIYELDRDRLNFKFSIPTKEGEKSVRPEVSPKGGVGGGDSTNFLILKRVEIKSDKPKSEHHEAMYKAAKSAVESMKSRVMAGQLQGGTSNEVYATYLRRLADAEAALATKPEDRIKAYESHLVRVSEAKKFNDPRVEKGIEEPHVLSIFEYHVAEAKLLLEQEKAKK